MEEEEGYVLTNVDCAHVLGFSKFTGSFGPKQSIIVGPSGSGKTTLFEVIGNVLRCHYECIFHQEALRILDTLGTLVAEQKTPEPSSLEAYIWRPRNKDRVLKSLRRSIDSRARSLRDDQVEWGEMVATPLSAELSPGYSNDRKLEASPGHAESIDIPTVFLKYDKLIRADLRRELDRCLNMVPIDDGFPKVGDGPHIGKMGIIVKGKKVNSQHIAFGIYRVDELQQNYCFFEQLNNSAVEGADDAIYNAVSTYLSGIASNHQHRPVNIAVLESFVYLAQDHGLRNPVFNQYPYCVSWEAVKNCNQQYEKRELDFITQTMADICNVVCSHSGSDWSFMKLDNRAARHEIVMNHMLYQQYGHERASGGQVDLLLTLLCLARTLRTGKPSSICLIDEPGQNLGVHERHQVRSVISDFDRTQRIIVTHHSELVDALNIEYVSTMKFERDPAVDLKTFASMALRSIDISSSKIIKACFLDPLNYPLLFARGVILVEGYSDVRFLTLLDSMLRSHDEHLFGAITDVNLQRVRGISFALKHCNSAGAIPHHTQMVNEIGCPIFTLRDTDVLFKGVKTTRGIPGHVYSFGGFAPGFYRDCISVPNDILSCIVTNPSIQGHFKAFSKNRTSLHKEMEDEGGDVAERVYWKHKVGLESAYQTAVRVIQWMFLARVTSKVTEEVILQFGDIDQLSMIMQTIVHCLYNECIINDLQESPVTLFGDTVSLLDSIDRLCTIPSSERHCEVLKGNGALLRVELEGLSCGQVPGTDVAQIWSKSKKMVLPYIESRPRKERAAGLLAACAFSLWCPPCVASEGDPLIALRAQCRGIIDAIRTPDEQKQETSFLDVVANACMAMSPPQQRHYIWGPAIAAIEGMYLCQDPHCESHDSVKIQAGDQHTRTPTTSDTFPLSAEVLDILRLWRNVHKSFVPIHKARTDLTGLEGEFDKARQEMTPEERAYQQLTEIQKDATKSAVNAERSWKQAIFEPFKEKLNNLSHVELRELFIHRLRTCPCAEFNNELYKFLGALWNSKGLFLLPE